MDAIPASLVLLCFRSLLSASSDRQTKIVLSEKADYLVAAEAHVFEFIDKITELLRLNEVPRRRRITPRPAFALAAKETVVAAFEEHEIKPETHATRARNAGNMGGMPCHRGAETPRNIPTPLTPI